MKNCKRCTRWRPLCDYRPSFGRGKEYLGHVCCHCTLLADRERALRAYYRKHELNKVKQRQRARARRREAGVPERGRYDVGRPVRVGLGSLMDLRLRMTK